MSYRAYHDYDDDRDVITCVTLSDTRPVTASSHLASRSRVRPRSTPMRAASDEVLGVDALKCASSASRARSPQLASRRRTPVMWRPTPAYG